MPDFKVNTDELAAGRGHQEAIAGAVGGAAWERHLGGHADVIRRTGHNLYELAPDLRTFLDSLTEQPPAAPPPPRGGLRRLFGR